MVLDRRLFLPLTATRILFRETPSPMLLNEPNLLLLQRPHRLRKDLDLSYASDKQGQIPVRLLLSKDVLYFLALSANRYKMNH